MLDQNGFATEGREAFMRALSRLAPCLLVVRRSLTAVTAIYALTSLVLGSSRAAWPVFWVLTSAALTVCVIQQLSPRGTQAPRRLWRCLELVAFNLCLTLLLAEGSLRTLALCKGTPFLLSTSLDACRLVPGHDYGCGLRGNQLGYPGEDFPMTRRPGYYRIAALGDSFAVGPAVPFVENYLTLLGDRLPRTEVLNFGVSGTGPREYALILQQHVWMYQPDLVLVSLFVGNDITEWLPTPRHMDPRRHALYLLLARGSKLVREWWRAERPPSQGEPDRLTAGRLSEETFREVEARRLTVCLKDTPAALETKWRRALGYCSDIIDDCRKRHVTVAFVLIPDLFQVDAKVLGEALEAGPFERNALDLDLPQLRLRGFFAERGVPCLDLRPVFSGVDDAYALRDTHWNVCGNRLAATAIATWLTELSVIVASQAASERPQPAP
jgi:hypothetical protein